MTMNVMIYDDGSKYSSTDKKTLIPKWKTTFFRHLPNSIRSFGFRHSRCVKRSRSSGLVFRGMLQRPTKMSLTGDT